MITNTATTRRTSSYQALKKQLDEAIASGMARDRALRIMVDAAGDDPVRKSLVLDAYRQSIREDRVDVTAAFESVLFNAPGFPGDPVAKAVADSLTGNVSKASEPEPTPEEQAQIDATADRIRKVRADLREPSAHGDLARRLFRSSPPRP